MKFVGIRNSLYALILLFCVAAVAHAEQGLVAHYTLDEGTGTTAADSSGNGSNGTLQNGPVWSTGMLSGALTFDGTNDYVNCPGVSWPAGGAVTVAFWNNVASNQVQNSIAFGMGTASPDRLQACVPFGDRKIYWDYGDGAGTGRLSVDYTAYLGKWTHVALVSAGIGGNFKAIYLNGVLVASGTSSDGTKTAKTGLQIGHSTEDAIGSFHHKGSIDEFRLYDRILTLSEIQALMQTAPFPANDNYGIAPDGTLTVDAPGVLINDVELNGDTMTALLEANVSHGSLALNANGSFTYTPTQGFTGTDSFSYRADDGKGNTSSPATVTIEIAALSVISVSPAFGPAGGKALGIQLNGAGFQQVSAPLSPPGAVGYNGHNYLFVSTTKTWTLAKADCISRGGHLVTFATSGENDFCYTLSGSQISWIGLTDEVTEGTFKWITGEPLSYTNWNSSEPNNSGNEDYAECGNAGRWNDSGSAVSRAYICEFEGGPGPVIKLKKGAASISASSVVYNSSTQLHFDIDLTTAATGLWDIEVTNPDNSVATLPAAFDVRVLQVSSIVPANGSTLPAPANIVVTFNAPFDTATATPQNVLVEGRGPDGTWDTADDAILSITTGRIDTGTSGQLKIDLTGLGLVDDVYRVTLSGARAENAVINTNYMTVANFGMVTPTNEITVEFWQQFTGPGTWIPSTFGYEPRDGNNECRVHSPWNSNNTIFWRFGSQTQAINNVNTYNVWSHFALVSSTAGNFSKIYRNGSLIGTMASPGHFVPYAGTLQVPASGSQPFLGRVDEFRVWNGVRTPEQIKANYKKGLKGTEPGLVAYWNFNETDGTTVFDKTTHGYNGTLTTSGTRTSSDAPLEAITGGGVLDGDSNGLPGGDFIATFTIQSPPTTTQASNASVNYRPGSQSLALNAVVTSPAGPINTGTVTFQIKNGNVNVGSSVTSAVVINGNASVTYFLPAATPPGTYAIQAAYNGATGLPPSIDTSHTLTVQPAPTTLAAANAVAPFNAVDADIVLTGTVTSPSGTVNEGNVAFQLMNGPNAVGSLRSGPVNGGTANVTYSIPGGTPLGSYTIEAAYTGTNFASSTDSSHSVVIAPPNSTAAFDTAATYKSSSQTIQLTAVVTGNAGAVNEGTVTFQIKDGAVNIGSAVASPTVNNGAAGVTYTIPAGTPANQYSINASYSGSANFAPSSDNSKKLTIAKAGTATTPANATAAYSFADQIATISIQVTSSAGVVNEGTVTVQLKSGAQNLGNAATSAAITNGTASVSYTIPGGTLPGVYAIQAVYNGGANFASSTDNAKTLTVLKSTPVITWPNPADIAYGTALESTQLNAGTGGIPGTFIYSPPSGTLLAVGNSQQLSVTFTPDDTVNYNAAQKTVAINVTKRALTVTADNKTKLFGAPNPPLTASYSGFVNGETAAVLTGSPVLSTSVTTSTPPGNYPIVISQGTLNAANYSFTFVNGTITVSNQPTFFNLSAPNVPYGTPTTALSGKISFGVTGAVSITFNGVTKSATIDASGFFSADFATQSVEVGAYPIQYFYPGGGAVGPATDAKTLTVIKATPAITWANPAEIPFGTQLSSAQLNATASVAGTFVYNPNTGTVLAKGTHLLSTSFSPTDSAHYVSASASVTLVVGLAQATITWEPPADIIYGAALSDTQLNATADIVGTFAYSPPTGTTLDAGDAQKLSLTFTPDDIVNYAVSHVDVFINVLKADQTITFEQIPDQEIGGPALTLSATASSRLPVTITLVSGNAALQDNVLSFNNLGAITLRAEQAGDNNFNAAPAREQTFHIIIIPPYLTSAPAASGTQGQAFTFTLTASGTRPLTFESGTLPAGLSLNANTGEISGIPAASGAFQISVTARNGGGTETKTLTLIFANSGGGENHAPKFTSGAIATPNPATVNVEVAFSASASDEDGDSVGIVWDFGDATQGFGSTTTHRYTASGIFAARVTITDGVVSDYLNVTIVVNGSVIPPDQFKQYTVSKLGLKFNFAKPNTDSLSISGTIPIPPAFSPEGKGVKFESAELEREWTLDKKATSADKAFKLTGKFAKDGTLTGSPAKFALALKNQGLFAGLAPLGFINDNTPKGMIVPMPVILVLEGTGYLATIDVKYSAKKGKSGAGKK